MFDDIVITDIISALTVISPRGRRDRIVNRKSYAISFCIEGRITYTHKGVKYVSEPNSAIILPKGETYTLYGNEKGVFPVINFDTADPLCDSHICIPIRDNEVFISEFEQLKSQLTFKKNRVKAMSIFYDILHKLTSSDNTADILLPALNYIEQNYSSPELSNAILAEQCRISEVYFRKLFIRLYRTTPRQFLIDIRLTKAKELLSNGCLSIGAISEMCGFSNPYHFSRSFKEREGVTPSEYIKENKAYKI